MRTVVVPRPLLVLAARQAGLVSTSQCDAEGLDRSRRARLVAARRVAIPTRRVVDLTTVLVEAGMAEPDGPDKRRRLAACLALLAHGPQAIAVGQSALALLGVEGLPPRIPPEVALPGGGHRRSRDAIVVRLYEQAMPASRRGPFLVVAPTWALAQAVCELDRDHAVAVLDSALNRGLVTASDLPEIARVAGGRRGAARLRDWWGLVDGRAQSPLETRARLQCVDAGVPPDELQVPVRDASGRIIARGDLGWRLRRGRWLIAEIDGAGPHGTPAAVFQDRRRQNAMLGTGRIDLLRFTSADLGVRGLLPAAIAAHRAQDALGQRRRSAS